MREAPTIVDGWKLATLMVVVRTTWLASETGHSSLTTKRVWM